MTQLPDCLTVTRIVLSLILLFLPAFHSWFYALYLVCGLTDVLDGWLARRFGIESRFGAQLDSAADFIFALVIVWRLFPILMSETVLLLWVALIIVLRLSAVLTAKLHFGVWGSIHTYGNKLAGLFLFFYPLTLPFTYSVMMLYALCAVAMLSAVEELVIELTSKQWDPDRKSFFNRVR